MPPRSSDTSTNDREFSAGGVVVRDRDVIVIVPVRRDARGSRVLGLPKGHPEDSETPAEAAARFGVRSQLAMAIYPLTGQPWLFGLHQCSYPRVWQPREGSILSKSRTK